MKSEHNLSPLNAPQDIFNKMAQGAIIITPNNRLSNHLLKKYFKTMQSSVLEKPVCIPYQAFLRHLFNELRHQAPYHNHPAILSAQQEHFLWQEVLKNQLSNGIQESFLEEVQNAWRICCQWQIEIENNEFSHTPLTQKFQQWREAYQAKLEQHHALSCEQITDYLIKNEVTLNHSEAIWACFNEFNPQQILLQSVFAKQKIEQYHYDLPETSKNAWLCSTEDQHHEREKLLSWLQSRLDTEKTIAIVVPQLQEQAQSLTRWLQRKLPNVPFNLSLGEPLSQFPIITHALAWIKLSTTKIANDKARLLLQSPYIHGAKKEFLNRSELLQNSRHLKEFEISLSAWTKELSHNTPELSKTLCELQPFPQKASVSEWHLLFKKRLKDIGFPGDSALSSKNYQCIQRLQLLFDEFLELGSLTDTLSQDQALNALSYQAKSTIFQLKQPSTTLHIMGLLEADGCTFDSLWCLGMDNQCLPEKTKLSPLIPIPMQKRLSMPKALPEKELELAEKVLSRLQNASKNTIFSFAKLIEDRPNTACTLINHLPELALSKDIPTSQLTELETYHETYQHPITVNEKISGTTALLSNQAKCPFRAFAAHRLYAKPNQEATLGPDASEKGQILHHIMEKLWKEIGSQKELLAMSPEHLESNIQTIIGSTLTSLTNFRSYSFSSPIKQVETQRLKQIIYSCLEWEKSRPNFLIDAVEKTYQLELEGIEFNVRVDRIDNVGNQKWVIDYKSTLPASKPWNSERPEETQMLLYAMLNSKINALLFLQLKLGKVTISGLSEYEFELPGLKALADEDSWADLKKQWDNALRLLAKEFREGYCPPEPPKASTCQFCDFPSLCRIELN